MRRRKSNNVKSDGSAATLERAEARWRQEKAQVAAMVNDNLSSSPNECALECKQVVAVVS